MSTFSVLISTYIKDNPLKLKRALDSIVNNTLTVQEIVLVGDGLLTEKQLEIISDFQQRCDHFKIKLQFVQISKNVGLPKALNIGLEHIATEWVFRMDSDDICTSDRFESQAEFQKITQADIVGGKTIEFVNEIEAKESYSERIVPIGEIKLNFKTMIRNPLNHMTVMYRKNDILAIGGYQDFKNFEDFELWIRAFNNNLKIFNIDKVICYVDSDSLIERRSGLKYLQSELKLYKYLGETYNLKLKYWSIGILRAITRLFPKFLLDILYKFISRKKMS